MKNSRRGRRRGAAESLRSRLPALRIPRVSWQPKRLGVAAAAVLLVTGMALVVWSAPGWGRGQERFLLSSFEVRGNRILTHDEVLALSGITIGSSLLDVNVSELEACVAASPRVERAQAVRALPGRVLVTLDERVPEALIEAGPGPALEITGDGRVLPPAAMSGAVDLPVITGAVGRVEPGMTEVPVEIREALRLLRLARHVSESLWMDISEVRIAPGSGLVIYTVADGAEIRVGSGALEPNDLRRLWHVLRDVRGRGRRVEAIDLRFKDQVIVKLS